MTSAAVLLTVLAPKALEEKLVDLLLEHEATAASIFVTREVSGHGANAAFHSVEEQIRGRARQIELTVLSTDADIRNLLGHLARALPGRGLAYRIEPVTETGTIG